MVEPKKENSSTSNEKNETKADDKPKTDQEVELVCTANDVFPNIYFSGVSVMLIKQENHSI